jgi:hypothetical protein
MMVVSHDCKAGMSGMGAIAQQKRCGWWGPTAVTEGRERCQGAGDDRGAQVGGVCMVSTIPLARLMRTRASKLVARGGGR